MSSKPLQMVRASKFLPACLANHYTNIKTNALLSSPALPYISPLVPCSFLVMSSKPPHKHQDQGAPPHIPCSTLQFALCFSLSCPMFLYFVCLQKPLLQSHLQLAPWMVSKLSGSCQWVCWQSACIEEDIGQSAFLGKVQH